MAMALSHVPPWLWRKLPELPLHPPPPPPPADASSLSQSPASPCDEIRLRSSESVPCLWSDDVLVPGLNHKSSVRSSKWPIQRPSDRKGEATVQRQRSGSSRRWVERQVDAEFDLVVVPPDGCCMSGSDSEDSDWSVGWFEPHSSDFSDSEDNFAVIVPCYGSSSPKLVATSRKSLLTSEDPQTLTSVLSRMSWRTSAGVLYQKSLFSISGSWAHCKEFAKYSVLKIIEGLKSRFLDMSLFQAIKLFNPKSFLEDMVL